VRAIFTRYLELGSMGALMEDLDRRGIRTKQRRGTDGRVMGGIRFGVGPVAYLLKNRFYIGEVVYRGETHYVAVTDRATRAQLLGDALQVTFNVSPLQRRGSRQHCRHLSVRERGIGLSDMDGELQI
jgi:hypothetical protein